MLKSKALRRTSALLGLALLLPVAQPTAHAAARSVEIKVTKSGTGLKAAWYYYGSKPTSQTLSITNDGDVAILPLKLKGFARSYTLTTVKPGVTYTFKITSTKPKLTATATYQQGTIPTVPLNVTTNRSGKDVTVSWAPPAVPAGSSAPTYTGIRVSVASGTSEPVVKTIGPDAVSYVLKDLSTAMKHTVRLQYVGNAGVGAFVDVTVDSSVPNAMTAPVATIASSTSARLDWSYTGPALTKQTVTISATGRTRDGETIKLAGDVRTTTIDGLSPAGVYTFTVSGENASGISKPMSAAPLTMITTPTTPSSVTLTAGPGSVTVSWRQPADNGGSPITAYRIEYKPATATIWNSLAAGLPKVGVDPTPAVATGLVNGTAYDFRLSASNVKGTSPYTEVMKATPFTVPGLVTTLVAAGESSAVKLTWAAPANNGGSPITGYKVEYRNSASAAWTTNPGSLGAGSTTATVQGLTNGTSYSFQVTAINAGGSSAPVSITASPYGVPGAPTALVATSANAKLDLTWAAPSDNGGVAALTYNIEYKATGAADWVKITQTGSTKTLVGLVNGTEYQIRISASTAKGTGAYSAVVSATPASTPGIATNITTTPGSSQVTVSWVAPASNGGAPITGYRVEYKEGTATDWSVAVASVNALTYTVGSLVPGKLYNFRVTAGNTAGFGAASTTAAGTPFTLPNAPATLVVSLDTPVAAGAVKLNWTEPSSTGGSVITGYRVEYKLSSANAWTIASENVNAVTMAISGLTPGLSHDFRVSAMNAAGSSAPRSASSTPQGPSGPVTNLVAAPLAGGFSISWSAPVNTGGSDVIGYRFEYRSSTSENWSVVSASSASSPTSVTGLTNGTSYIFRVTPITSMGAGSSSTVEATLATTPGAVSSLGVSMASATEAVVTWQAPADNGGSAVTSYRIESKLSTDASYAGYDSVEEPTFTFTGLDSSARYDFRVVAVNNVGAGASAVVSTPAP